MKPRNRIVWLVSITTGLAAVIILLEYWLLDREFFWPALLMLAGAIAVFVRFGNSDFAEAPDGLPNPVAGGMGRFRAVNLVVTVLVWLCLIGAVGVAITLVVYWFRY